jgi:hypothetical protein
MLSCAEFACRMGAGPSLAQEVHQCPSYAERVALIESGLSDSRLFGNLSDIPDLSEVTDISGITLLMRICQLFRFPQRSPEQHLHPDFKLIRTNLLRAIDEMKDLNFVNRDGEGYLNIIFHCLTSIDSKEARRDPQVWQFYWAVTQRLIAIGRPPPAPRDSDPFSPPRRARPQFSNEDIDDPPITPLNINQRSARFNNCPIHAVLSIDCEQYS